MIYAEGKCKRCERRIAGSVFCDNEGEFAADLEEFVRSGLEVTLYHGKWATIVIEKHAPDCELGNAVEAEVRRVQQQFKEMLSRQQNRELKT